MCKGQKYLLVQACLVGRLQGSSLSGGQPHLPAGISGLKSRSLNNVVDCSGILCSLYVLKFSSNCLCTSTDACPKIVSSCAK